MSQLESRILDHRVWKLLELFGPLIDKAISLKGLGIEELGALERLRSVLALCGKRLAATDPRTVVPATIEAIAHAYENQQAQVEAFITDQNIVHLNDANSNADTALLSVAQLPGVQSKEEFIGLMEATSAYRKAIDKAASSWADSINKSQNELVDLKSKLDAFSSQMQASVVELKGLIEAERQKILTQAAEQNKAFSEAQEARSATYTETLRKTHESLSATLSEQQGQFSTAQEARSVQFAATQADIQKTFSDLTGSYTKSLAAQDAAYAQQINKFGLDVAKRIEEIDKKYRGDAEKVLEAVNARRSEVETLVGVIGSLGVTSGYKKTADNAQKSMWAWQLITVLSLIALILFAWFAFVPALKGDFHWSSFAARIVLTVTVGVLAAYSGTQADRFFHMEKQNRRLALELAAIDPFIALLPVEDQNKFKLEVARRTFAQENSDEATLAGKSPATTIDLLAGTKEGQKTFQTMQSLVEMITKISQAFKG
jgi:hypothetical protein